MKKISYETYSKILIAMVVSLIVLLVIYKTFKL
jgi:hypothetical protein